ncbi:hypothetical protein FOZ61_007493 [Perkinsus olseni]|uniref:Uncharacterized protein n=1 Tax=Perkinsus olseni TaxID=32597 RepID=A0A7J6L8S2_PEROL|nr:hypothetical protein FOZ61_007493 [Perkinsus olseni]
MPFPVYHQSLPPSTARGRPIVSREEHEDLKEAVAFLRCELDEERARRLKLERIVKLQRSRARSDGEYAFLADPAVLTTQPPLVLFLHDCFRETITSGGGIGPPPRAATQDPWATPLRPERCRASSQASSRWRRRSKPLSECTSSAPLSAPSEGNVGVQSPSPLTVRPHPNGPLYSTNRPRRQLPTSRTSIGLEQMTDSHTRTADPTGRSTTRGGGGWSWSPSVPTGRASSVKSNEHHRRTVQSRGGLFHDSTDEDDKSSTGRKYGERIDGADDERRLKTGRVGPV